MIMPAWLHSAAPWLTSRSHSQVSQIFPDHPLQTSILRKLVFERPTQSGHSLRERLAVILLRLGADVAAGGEYVAVLADLLKCGTLAEAWNVLIFKRAFSLTPTLSRREKG
jgi:hypothetical protein